MLYRYTNKTFKDVLTMVKQRMINTGFKQE